jgi:hypothetical protein
MNSTESALLNWFKIGFKKAMRSLFLIVRQELQWLFAFIRISARPSRGSREVELCG